MTNYIVMWERDGNDGFDFVNAVDMDEAIDIWTKVQSGYHPDGRLHKMIITETDNTHKVALDSTDYYYGSSH